MGKKKDDKKSVDHKETRVRNANLMSSLDKGIDPTRPEKKPK